MGRNCKYCGAYISSELDVCPACGRPVIEGSGTAEAYASQPKQEEQDREEDAGQDREKKAENRAYTYKQEYERRYGGSASASGSSEPYTASETEEDGDVRQNKSLSYLCYFGFLFFIPYLMRRDSDFVRFHSNQGLLLFLADIAVSLLGKLPIIGGLISGIGGVFVLVCFIMGLVNVSHGVKKRLPVIGEIEILK